MADTNASSNNMYVFIVGGLVVAVAVIGWLVFNGGITYRSAMPGANQIDVKIEAPSTSTTEAPAASEAPAAAPADAPAQ